MQKTLPQLFADRLRRLGACDDAVTWVGERDEKMAIAECKRGDWLLWYCAIRQGAKNYPTKDQVTLLACDCAARALRFVPDGENRPRLAIEATRADVARHTPETAAARAAARDAAGDARDAVGDARAAAWAAARGAAWAAGDARGAAWAAGDARDAARAAAWAAARGAAWAAGDAARAAGDAESLTQAELIRERLAEWGYTFSGECSPDY